PEHLRGDVAGQRLDPTLELGAGLLDLAAQHRLAALERGRGVAPRDVDDLGLSLLGLAAPIRADAHRLIAGLDQPRGVVALAGRRSLAQLGRVLERAADPLGPTL